MRWLISATVLILVAIGWLIINSYILPSGEITTATTPPASTPPDSPNSNKAKGKKTSAPDVRANKESSQLGIAINETAKTYESTRNYLLIALIALSIATFLSVAISFYLYRWRRLLIANSHMVVPEAFGSWITNLKSEIQKHSQSSAHGLNDIDQRCGDMEKRISALIDTFMSLHKALDEKDAEIKRLKRGYDADIYLKFVGRFIRVDQAVGDILTSEKINQADLEQIKKLLEDALDECGLEKFSPNIGDDYRKAHGVADNPKIIPSQKPDDAFNIAEVIEAGYRRRNQDGYEVILPAKVKIFGMSA